ncbi:MFS transporter [Streptacidiphilus monticola]|uniref:MFS transporter n=1 Tax=Streptacidiphilus monticola TaxID=2161674 RepID=A0ABW1GD44_9ACTN
MVRPARVVALLVLLEFASGLLQGGFPVLLPGLADRLHLSAGDQSLATGIEFLVSGMAVPLTSRLGDLQGHRRWLRITLALTVLGCTLTALADSLAVLLAGRVLAGFLSCWLPLEFAIVRDRVGEERSGRVIGQLVGTLTLGSILGAVAVGQAGSSASALRLVLWVLAVLPLLGLALAWRGVPDSRVRATGRLDWLGAGLLSLGLSLLFACLGGLGLGAPGTAGLLAGAAVLLVLFVRQELRSATPLVDLRVLAGRATAPVFVLSFLLGCVLYGAQAPTRSFQAAVPAQAGYGLGADSRLLGLLTLPSVLGALLGAVTADRLGRRFGARRVLAASFALAAAGYGCIALRHSSAAGFVPTGLLAGYGGGLGLALLPALLIQRLPAEQTGIGTGVYNTLKTLAGAVTGAAGAALLDAELLRAGVPDEGAYVAVWGACALLSAVGVPVALALRGAGRGGGDRVPAEVVQLG